MLLMFPTVAAAQPIDDCPKKIASISEDANSGKAPIIFKKIYEMLGCPIEITELPTRRGVFAFNHSTVDGELFRLPIVERFYTRPFVRSDIPVYEFSNSLWVSPQTEPSATAPIGYILGAIWQEEYIKSRDLPGLPLRSAVEMFAKFSDGEISRFISADETVEQAIKDGVFKPGNIPMQQEVVKIGKLYHYLGSEFAPFMKRFSTFVANLKTPLNASNKNMIIEGILSNTESIPEN